MKDFLTFPVTEPAAIFLLVLLIILLVPMLLRRLKIPSLVGLILAGMAVGPHGFNILARDASFSVFGQVGIIYLMFLAGVEIDLYHLRKNLRSGTIFGLLTFTLPMAVGIFVNRWAFGAGWSTAVLLASMYASHTLITYPTVTRFGLSGNRGVIISACGTMLAVFLALIALAEVVDINTQGGFRWRSLAILGVNTIIYSAVIGFAYPALTRWFFRRYNDAVTQVIYILALVLLAAVTAQWIGLEGILGAFYAGLVVNRYVPVRSPLMSRLVFAGNAIFIPYFLIGVGMLMDVRALVGGWGVLYVAAVMTGTALLTKWLAAYGAKKLFTLRRDEFTIMFGLTSGKAAATIAATMVGYQYGLLDEDMMNAAVIMILICCAVASVVTERSALRLRMSLARESLAEDVNEGERQNARQVVAVANPVTAEEIMNLAILMRHPDNTREMTALYVRDNDDPSRVTAGRNALHIAAAAAMAVDVPVCELERFDINIVAGMVNVMKERGSSDLIIGMHRKTRIVDTFFGTVIEQFLQASNKMLIMSRCFIPVDTVRRLMVLVPPKGEYETGFRTWVERTGNLATQLGCRVVFMTSPETARYIRGVLEAGDYSIRTEYRNTSTWDDWIMQSADVEADDLMVVIGARRTSISFSSDMERLPGYLEKYFNAHNLLVIYPEQFGAEADKVQPMDVLMHRPESTPTRRWPFAKKR